MGALDNIRVIDLGHYVAGPLLGMLLADQGAEVVKVDPPGGPVFDTPANRTWNRGKKSIALDLRAPDDVAVARELIKGADVVVENFRPGQMATFGLELGTLQRENPGLIVCSMPAFAPDDPRAAMPGWEGIVMAATDVFRPLTEYRNMVQVLHQSPEDRAGRPVYTAEPIASSYAALLASVCVLSALNSRETSGRGQAVQVPLFDAMIQAVGIFALARLPFKAQSASAFSGFDHQYQCSDGRWIQVVCTVPRHGEIFLADQGRQDLIDQGMAARGLGAKPDLNRELTDFLSETFRTKRADEWEAYFRALDIPGVQCLSTAEWLRHPQATEGDLLVDIVDPVLGAMRQPGRQVKLAGSSDFEPRPAPLSDQHRDEVLAMRRQDRPRGTPDGNNRGLPLTGLKVLDLCIILAGPTCGRTLAELGADVIKIDDPQRGNVIYHHDINRGKRTILLDLRSSDGMEIFWQLIDQADVVVQNFRLDVVKRLGIDYEAVKRRKPEIIYVSLNAYGDTGPMANQPGYEEAAQALTGMQVRYGGSAQPIIWPYGVVNDYGTGYAGAFGVLMALLARRKTGTGQEVSSALARTACTLQSAYLQDYVGKTWDEPSGPDALGAADHQRLFECQDGWIFVAAKSAAAIADHLGLEKTPDFVPALECWCRERSREQAVAALVSHNIAAHALTWMNDMASDLQTIGRGLIVEREHQRLGLMRTTGPGPWFSESTLRPGRPAPMPGADAQSILNDIGRNDLDALVENKVIALSTK